MKCATNKRGFTLAEALMATALLALCCATLGEAIVAGQMQAYDAQRTLRATIMGEELMERVLSLPYNDPNGASNLGPEAGEASPGGFDNIDDYHGYHESAGSAFVHSGVAVPPDLDVFDRSVTVTYGSMTVPAYGAPITGLTVLVTLTDAAGRRWTFTKFVPAP